MYCNTATTYRVHLATHKKTPCPFLSTEIFPILHRNKHIGVKHSDRGDRKLNCRLALNCKQTLQQYEGIGYSFKAGTWKMYPFRCSYKDCFDCYRTIDALVKHCKTHGRETQDTTAQEKSPVQVLLVQRNI